MGLTVHYSLGLNPKWSKNDIVAKLQVVQQFAKTLPIRSVSEVVSPASDCEESKAIFDYCSRSIENPSFPGSSFFQDCSKTDGYGFIVDPAEGSEWIRIGVVSYDSHIWPAHVPEDGRADMDKCPKWGCMQADRTHYYPASDKLLKSFMKKWGLSRFRGKNFFESGGGWYAGRPEPIEHSVNFQVGSATVQAYKQRSSWRKHRTFVMVQLGDRPFNRTAFPPLCLVTKLTPDEFLAFTKTVKGSKFRVDISSMGLGQDHVTPGGLFGMSTFCKTHYAINYGIENFLSAHLSLTAILDKCKEVGFRVKVYDEGNFWKKRDIKALTEEIGGQAAMISAFVGALKDGIGGDCVSAPATEHPQFEHLEAKGSAMLGKLLDQIKKGFSNVKDVK